MRILHFATYDIFGGAAKASYRLHKSLKDAGNSSWMIVRYKQSDDPDIHPASPVWPSRLERIRRRIPWLREHLPTPSYMFNLDVEHNIDTRPFFSYQSEEVDIICLHWITNLLTVKMIHDIYGHYQRPMVWTLMDQEPVTGGCHYSFGCDGFANQCGYCPQLDTSRSEDRSRTVWRRKQKYLQGLPMTFVAPTSWAAMQVRESSLFREHRVELIPLAIDTAIFRPFDWRAARDLLHVPQDKKAVLFGATYLEDPRKGMSYLMEALHYLSSMMAGQSSGLSRESVLLLVVGSNSRHLLEPLPFPSRHLGQLKDDFTLALAYQAADVFVCPSVEDAGPMMIPEAMLCGTPVVAFDTGGAPDLIETMKTGYLAAYKDSSDLANGLYQWLTIRDLSAIRPTVSEVAARKHTPSIVTARYLKLFNSLLNNKQKRIW